MAKLYHTKSYDIDNPIDIPQQTGTRPVVSARSVQSNKRLFFVLWSGMILVLGLLVGRTFFLQVVRGSHFQEVSEHNRIRSQVIKAPRGIIRDYQGEVLARNVPSYDAVYTPMDLPLEYTQRKKMYAELAELLTMNETNIESMLESSDRSKRESFLLKENIGRETALAIEEQYRNLSGIYVENTARREYVDGPVFSSILGYDGKVTREELEAHPTYLMTDYIGKNGLEYSYEEHLRGVHGAHRMEVDSNGNVKEDLGLVNPVQGNALELYLDAALQRKMTEILGRIMERNPQATGATAVAIDPRNGGVRALVNVPSYDNNLFAGGISHEDYVTLLEDEKKPMMNRAISGEYPPGSTFKPLVAAAALQERLIDEHTTVSDTGSISIGSWVFPDWKTHGVTDVRKAIAESCDVFFYAIGGGWDTISGLGITRIGQYAHLFGLGKPLGIDLPWEGKGLIPTTEWKQQKLGEKWYIGDDYHCSIGQGFITTTPLQLATYIAAVANGGKVYRPSLVHRIIRTKDQGAEDKVPEVLAEQFITPSNMKIVQEGMRQTVMSGSGRQLSSLQVSSAGKTGTAQFGNEGKLHSWYVSFAPFEHPELAMVVLIEGGGEGHSWAVPATREIYRWYFDLERGKRSSENDSVFERSLNAAIAEQGNGQD